MPNDDLKKALLAGLASEAADPHARDEAEAARHASITADDYYFPPDPSLNEPDDEDAEWEDDVPGHEHPG